MQLSWGDGGDFPGKSRIIHEMTSLMWWIDRCDSCIACEPPREPASASVDGWVDEWMALFAWCHHSCFLGQYDRDNDAARLSPPASASRRRLIYNLLCRKRSFERGQTSLSARRGVWWTTSPTRPRCTWTTWRFWSWTRYSMCGSILPTGMLWSAPAAHSGNAAGLGSAKPCAFCFEFHVLSSSSEHGKGSGLFYCNTKSLHYKHPPPPPPIYF